MSIMYLLDPENDIMKVLCEYINFLWIYKNVKKCIQMLRPERPTDSQLHLHFNIDICLHIHIQT